jgi:guanylate kinase
MWVEGWGQLPGQLVVVSGPSGSGKSSIIRAAVGRPGHNLRLSVSATTRDRRPGEEEGLAYYFLSRDSFQAKINSGRFLEWAEYNNNLYGTPAEPVYQALSEGKTVLLEIEVRGALQVRDHAPSTLFIFIRTPTFQTLEERLRTRGTETESVILRRLRRAREELAEAHWYDVQIVNDQFDDCVDEFVRVVQSNVCGG